MVIVLFLFSWEEGGGILYLPPLCLSLLDFRRHINTSDQIILLVEKQLIKINIIFVAVKYGFSLYFLFLLGKVKRQFQTPCWCTHIISSWGFWTKDRSLKLLQFYNAFLPCLPTIKKHFISGTNSDFHSSQEFNTIVMTTSLLQKRSWLQQWICCSVLNAISLCLGLDINTCPLLAWIANNFF